MNALARALIVFLTAVVAVLVLAMAAGLVVIVQTRNSARANAKLLEITLAVANCTTADSPAQCRQRQVDRAAAEGAVRVLEVDCRMRAALAGKPPLGVTEHCVP